MGLIKLVYIFSEGELLAPQYCHCSCHFTGRHVVTMYALDYHWSCTMYMKVANTYTVGSLFFQLIFFSGGLRVQCSHDYKSV